MATAPSCLDGGDHRSASELHLGGSNPPPIAFITQLNPLLMRETTIIKYKDVMSKHMEMRGTAHEIAKDFNVDVMLICKMQEAGFLKKIDETNILEPAEIDITEDEMDDVILNLQISYAENYKRRQEKLLKKKEDDMREPAGINRPRPADSDIEEAIRTLKATGEYRIMKIIKTEIEV